jgi:hypothetical protein
MAAHAYLVMVEAEDEPKATEVLAWSLQHTSSRWEFLGTVVPPDKVV